MNEIRAHATATPRMQLAAAVLLLRSYKAASDALYQSQPGSPEQRCLMGEVMRLREQWEGTRATLTDEAQTRVIEAVMNCSPRPRNGQATLGSPTR